MIEQQNTTHELADGSQPPLTEIKILLENFISIHELCITSAAQSAVEMQSGARTFDYAKFCLVFNLAYNVECTGNPSTTFVIQDVSFVRIDDL